MEHKEEVDMETLWFGWVGLYCVVLDGLVPNVGRKQANSFDIGWGSVGNTMVYGVEMGVKGSF